MSSTINGTWKLQASLATTEAFTGSGSYEEVLVLNVGGLEHIRIRGTVAGTALTGLKISSNIVPGQTHRDYLTDADFDTPFNMMPWCSKTSGGSSLYQTGVGETFEFILDTRGLRELKLYVKSSGAGSVALQVGT